MPPLPPLPSQYGVPPTSASSAAGAAGPAGPSSDAAAAGGPTPEAPASGAPAPADPPAGGPETAPLGAPPAGGPDSPAAGAVRAQQPRRAPRASVLLIGALLAGLVGGAGGAYGMHLAAPAIGGSSPTVVQGEGGGTDWTAVAEAVSESVVSLQVSGADGTSQGSGVVWDDQGHILTNHHVIATAAEEGDITVLVGNRAYPATLVGSDAATDLAVVRLDEIPEGLTAIARGDSEAITVGDDVMAVGSPLGLSGSVTTGIVSALDRPVSTGQSSDSLVVTNAIQTSAPLNPGNSGGALVDAAGQLIGINSAIATLGQGGQSSGSIGIGFAIPIQLAANIAEQLIETGEVQHAFLGTKTTNGTAELEGSAIVGAEVREVVADSPAESAGIEEGDLIVAVNDKPITGSEHLVGTVRTLNADEVATFTVVRDGEEQQIDVTMGVSDDLGD